MKLLYNVDHYTTFSKDAMNRWGSLASCNFRAAVSIDMILFRFVIQGEKDALNPERRGTKASAHYILDVPAGGEVSVKLRLCDEESIAPGKALDNFDSVFCSRLAEAEEFYNGILPKGMNAEERNVTRQAYAGKPGLHCGWRSNMFLCVGLLWSKQFYHYIVDAWLEGDPDAPTPPAQRKGGRNKDWKHLFNRDIISMPDKWEYPWVSCHDLCLFVALDLSICLCSMPPGTWLST